eukprot:4949982-Prymnesium_polylepis.1
MKPHSAVWRARWQSVLGALARFRREGAVERAARVQLHRQEESRIRAAVPGQCSCKRRLAEAIALKELEAWCGPVECFRDVESLTRSARSFGVHGASCP